MEETEMEMEGGLSPASLLARASLATRPVWDPGLPAWRHEAGVQRPACGTGSLLAVGLGRDLIRGALLDGAHGSWRKSSSFSLPPSILPGFKSSRPFLPGPPTPTLWGHSDKHFPGSLTGLGKMELTVPRSHRAQPRPPTPLHRASLSSSESVPLPPAQSPLTAQSHTRCGTAQNAKMRQNGKALKRGPSANFHLLRHLASFSPRHMEPVFVGLDSSGRSG